MHSELEERQCRWCGEYKICILLEMSDNEWETFIMPVCEECVKNSPGYSINAKLFMD